MGCGVVGVSNTFVIRPAASDAYVGGLALVHRGKESAGIAVSDGRQILCHRGMGEIPQVFTESILQALQGHVGIAETRYSTMGGSTIENAPPAEGVHKDKLFYLIQNGSVINARELRRVCESAGRRFEEETGAKTGPSDTRIIAALVSLSQAPTLLDAVLEVLPLLKGAFCFLFLDGDTIIAVRDRIGYHPLQLGQRKEGYVVASESCVFDHLGAELIRDIQPGEVVVIEPGREPHSFFWTEDRQLKIDLFEFIYFARPDSIIHGVRVQYARELMGRYMADEHPKNVDKIIPIPDSGNAGTFGYWRRMWELGSASRFAPWRFVERSLTSMGLRRRRFEHDPSALFRPHTASRTFIEPFAWIRDQYLNQKFNPIPEGIRGRSLGTGDDSRVRGATDGKTAAMLRGAGAREIHALKFCPMYMWPDFTGIDTWEWRDELDARVHGGDLEAMARASGLDSLAFLSLESTKRAVIDTGRRLGSPHFNLTMENFYDAPFTGNYPEGTGDYEIL